MAAATGRTCYFWDCEEPISRKYFLCYEHYDEYQEGLLDECEECGWWKYAKYDLCLDCEQQPQQSEPQYRRDILRLGRQRTPTQKVSMSTF